MVTECNARQGTSHFQLGDTCHTGREPSWLHYEVVRLFNGTVSTGEVILTRMCYGGI